MRRSIAGALLAALLMAAGCAPATVDHEQVSPTERSVARFSHVTAENSPKHLAAVRFAEAVAERSGGSVEIQVYPNSQLHPDWEEIDALKDGHIQFIAVAPSKLTEFDPAWQVYDLPYLFTSFADVERLFASPVGQSMRQRLADKGLVALAIWPNGFKQFTNRIGPLVEPEDFRGLTFRVQAGQVLQDQFAAVGARAVVSSFNTLYADIEGGQIDAQENTLNNIYTRNLQAVQPYLTLSDHGFISYVVITRAPWWNALEAERRAAVQAGLSEATSWVKANAQAINEESLIKLKESGRVAIRMLTKEEREALRTAFGPVYTGIAGRLGRGLLEQVIQAAAGTSP